MSIHDTDLSIRDEGASARRMAAERQACRRFATEALEAGGLERLVLAAQGVAQNRSSAEHRQAAIDYLETALADLGIKP